MTTARDIMTPDATCAGENESLADVARKTTDLDVGSLPIRGEDDRLNGMVTDLDIVTKAIAQGRDPASVRAASSARASRSRSAPTTMWRRCCEPWRSTRGAGCR